MTGTVHIEALTSLKEALVPQHQHIIKPAASHQRVQFKLDQPELAIYDPDTRVPLAIFKVTAPLMTTSDTPIKPTQLIIESANPITKPPAVKQISTPIKSIAEHVKAR